MNQESIAFLIRAKRATYAAGMPPSTPSRPRSKDLQYREGSYLYIDTYLGDIDFIGEEAVWLEGQAIWGMNYYGWMLTESIPDGFSACLKGALLELPQHAPFRGPELFNSGNFIYCCQWEGRPERFHGEECISIEGEVIYRLAFHGGSILSFTG
jgi:hypothetical protein